MGFLANLLVKIGVDTRDLNAGMDKATRSVNRFAQDVESAGMRMSAGITLPIVALGAAAIKTAGQMEQTQVAFTTLLKSADAAKSHLEELKRFALTTPFQFEDLTKASRLMQAYGFAAADVVPKLRIMGNAVSALGGGSDLLERVVRSMGEIGTRGKITGEQLRELSRAGIPALDAIAQKLGVSVAEAQKQITAGTVDAKTAMDALLGYMQTRFAGGMEAQSKTVLGSWSNIKDKITFTLADIGKALLPVAQNVMRSFIDPLLAKTQELAAEFGKLSPAMQGTLLGVGAGAAAFPLLTIAIGATITNTIAIAGVISKTIPLVTALANVIAGLGSKTLGLLVTSFSNVGSGYTAMLATGVLRVAAWTALAYEIYKVVAAYNAASDAKRDAAKSTKEQEDSLLALEIALKRQGADISEIQKQYGQGSLTWTQYMQKLRDVAIQLGKNISQEQQHAVKIVDIDKMLTDAGMKTMAQRKKDLEEAKTLYAAVAEEYGSGSVFALEAMERVKQATAALVPTIQEVKNKATGLFRFGETSVDDAIFLATMRQKESELQKWIEEVAKAGGLQKYNAQTALEMANAMELLANPPAVDGLRSLTKTAEEALTPIIQMPDDLKRAADALDFFGLAGKRTDIELMERQFNALGQGFETGAVSVEQYTRAWIALVKAMDAAGVPLSEGTIREVIGLEKQYGGQIKETRKEQSELEREVTRVFHSVSRGIASSIVNFKGWGETFKNIAKDTAQSILTIFIEGMFKKLAKQFADLLANAKGVLGKIGGWLGGIASGGSSAAGSAASSGASAAGAAGSGAGGAAGLASGLAGTVNMVSGVVTAASSVVGNFQMAGMNKSLDVLVNHTLRIFNVVYQMLDEHYLFKGQLFAKMDDMWRTNLNIYDLLGKGGVGGGKGGVQVNFYGPVNGDPNAIAQSIFDKLALANG